MFVQKRSRLLNCMGRLQLVRTILAVTSLPQPPPDLLLTACAAVEPHVPHLKPLQLFALLRLLAACKCPHQGVFLAAAAAVPAHIGEFSAEQKDQLAACFKAAHMLVPEPLQQWRHSAAEGRKQSVRPRGKRGFDLSDGFAALAAET